MSRAVFGGQGSGTPGRSEKEWLFWAARVAISGCMWETLNTKP